MSDKEFEYPSCGHRVFEEDCGVCHEKWDEYHEPMSKEDKSLYYILETKFLEAQGDDAAEHGFEYYYGKHYRRLRTKMEMEEKS